MLTAPRHTRYVIISLRILLLLFFVEYVRHPVRLYSTTFARRVYFGPDCVLDFNGSCFSASWPHFVVSEAERLTRVGDAALNPNVAYLMGGNVVDKPYMATLPEELRADWLQFINVCGFLEFPAFLNLDPSPIVNGISRSFALPSTVHLGSYLCQKSDAEHPPNVILMIFVGDSDPEIPPRFQANILDLYLVFLGPRSFSI